MEPAASRAARMPETDEGDRPRRRDDGREPRRGRLHGHLHAHPRHGRLRLARRAAQPHVILFVPGSALQVAAAREGTLGRLGRGGELAGTLARWTRHILIVLVVVAVARGPGARAARRAAQRRAGVGGRRRARDRRAVAAAVPPARAAAVGARLPRGRAEHRLRGARPARRRRSRSSALGLGVTGAYLGTAASLALTAVVLESCCAAASARPTPGARQHPLRALARDAALPIAALTVVAALQNVDVIMAKHALTEDVGGRLRRDRRSPPRRWCGSRSGSASGSCPRRPAAPPPAPTRAPCSPAGWAVIAAVSACALTVFADRARAAAADRVRPRVRGRRRRCC